MDPVQLLRVLSLNCLSLYSVKHLELQVTSLETEVDRLSQSLDSQKVVTATVESNTRKVAEERAREASTAVCSVRFVRMPELTLSVRHGR
jgi:uncharacterized small protein (DUF1192 family)